MTSRSWFWRRRSSTLIVLSLNASLQPIHRAEWFGDFIEDLLRRTSPGSKVTGGGSLLSEQREILRSDIEMRVSGEARAVLDDVIQAITEHRRVPRGSYASVKGERIEFGNSAGVAVRMVPAPEIDASYDSVPGNEKFVNALARANSILGASGAAYSWMIRDHRASAYFSGDSAEEMGGAAISALSRDFPDARFWVDTTA